MANQTQGAPRRLGEIYVFLSRNAEGDEGIAAFWNPRLKRLEAMVAATEQRKDELLEIAQGMVSLDPSKPILIVRYHEREDVAEVVAAPPPADPEAAA